jgi:hypothetical protein
MPKRTGRKPTDMVQVNLRVREDMRRMLVLEAARRKRTLNEEMVERLRASFWVHDSEQINEAVNQVMQSSSGYTEVSLVHASGANITVSNRSEIEKSFDAKGPLIFTDECGLGWILSRAPGPRSVEGHFSKPRGRSVETDFSTGKPNTLSKTEEEGK